jgi:replication factor C large subunit
MTWTRVHGPKSLKDFVQPGVAEFTRRMASFKPGKAILLLGPTGTGKSLSVHTFAKEHDREVVELNASDFRNADAIQSIVGNAVSQGSLFGKGKIILIDDLDGIAGSEDRGGVQALVKIIEKSRVPIVMTGNDVSDKKFSPLRKAAITIAYNPVAYGVLVEFLREVCEKERIKADPDALKMLARMSEGDVRAAVNDLQGIAAAGPVTREAVEQLPSRDRVLPLAQGLLRVFKTKDVKVALAAYDHLDEDLDGLFLWLEENVPREYRKAADLARALDALAEADRFRGRIRRWQYYRFQVYCYALLSAGIALAKEERYPDAQEFVQSTRLLKIWISNQKLAKKKSIAKKMTLRVHASARRIVQDALPFMRVMMKNKAVARELASYFNLDKEEVEWLAK